MKHSFRMLDCKIVIYDFDGVIVDSREANLAYYNRLLRHFGGSTVGPEHWEIIQTRTSREVIEILFPDPVMAEEVRGYEKKMTNDGIIPLIRLEPHIKETLEGLKRSYYTAIATNRGKSLPLVMQFHDLGRYFDFSVSSSELHYPKPYPGYLEVVLQKFSLTPDQAVYIGDAEVDARLAAAVGVPFLAYKNSNLAAWAHLNDHREILTILRQ